MGKENEARWRFLICKTQTRTHSLQHMTPPMPMVDTRWDHEPHYGAVSIAQVSAVDDPAAEWPERPSQLITPPPDDCWHRNCPTSMSWGKTSPSVSSNAFKVKDAQPRTQTGLLTNADGSDGGLEAVFGKGNCGDRQSLCVVSRGHRSDFTTAIMQTIWRSRV